MWDILWYAMLILYIPSCIGLIVIVLLQKGKGVGFAGAFGVGGGSDTVFGPRMNKTLPQRLTHGMAAVFMILALGMSLVSGRLGKGVAPDAVPEAMSEVDFSGLEDLGSGLGGLDSGLGVESEDGEASEGGSVAVTPVEDATEEGAMDSPGGEAAPASAEGDAAADAPQEPAQDPAPSVDDADASAPTDPS